MLEQSLIGAGPFDPLWVVVTLVLVLLVWATIVVLGKFLVSRAMNHAMTEIEVMLYHFDFLRTESARSRTTPQRVAILLHRAKRIAEHATILEAREFERDWRTLFAKTDPLAVEADPRTIIRRPAPPKEKPCR